ncbi:hypothetical protein GWK47_052787 [Chionoecetes opilio]|uniref:Uncharacterized protein n=1 Tax=Chionoecetes opilio TaxID=41210 RepID=A0A8J4Y8L4_CHIOP|nr:hypothetical protein GWK47_052787 [Chionoecetes opilio]
MACENMKRVQKEAINNWRDHLKRKLTGQSVGTKDWLSSIKQQQDFSRDDSIPPLTAPDGSVVTSHRGKAQVLAAHFSSKMTVPDPEREPPTVPVLTKASLGNITITTEEVLQQLQQAPAAGIASWGKRWQVTLAPDKIQAILISRRQDAVNWDQHAILLEGRKIHLQESVNILGVEFDSGLTYTSHVRKVAKDAAWKLSCIRLVAHLLDAQGFGTLYKSQVRYLMEYSPSHGPPAPVIPPPP